MPLVPDTARWACLYNTRGAKARSGWAESGSALNAPWCEEIRGDVRGWPWAYLLPSSSYQALLHLLSGGRGGSDGLARPPAAEKPKCANIPSSPFYSMTQYFGNFSREFRRYGERRSKCVALYDGPSHISISERQ